MVFTYDLTRIANREQLLTFLGVDGESFDLVLEFDPEKYAKTFRTNDLAAYLASPFRRQHEVPKKNQKDLWDRTRTLWEATSAFDRQYKATSRRLDAFFSFKTDEFPHDHAYGYILGRNIRQNAMRHLGQRNILICDIEEFFGSIRTTKAYPLCSGELHVEVTNLLIAA